MIDYEKKSDQNGRVIALMVIASLVVIGGFLAFARWSTALANTPDINNARTQYGISGTRIDSCSLCHTSNIPSLNSFGSAYSSGGRNTAALIAINSTTLDSDGDGYSNNAEITALFFPGDANDHPVPPTATSVPPTATNVPPTATSVPPTATSVPPTATNVPPTATGVPPTATSVPPTATRVPPTVTGVPPTATSVPPTATGEPPTATSVAPSATPQVTLEGGSTPIPTMKPTREPRPTEVEETDEPEEPEHTPEVKPTRRPKPTESEEHHATPTPKATRQPRPTSTDGCRKGDDSSSNGNYSSSGNRYSGYVRCTPVPDDDSKNTSPVRPNRSKERSQVDNFVVALSKSSGFLDVPRW